jgi:hypothetical protein
VHKFTLYWTNLDNYEKCPRKFLWGRGWADIDLGAGPGRRKPVPYKKSRHHAVMGIVIQAVLEDMYNDELYRDPRGLPDRLLGMIEREWAKQTAKDWNWIDYRIAGTKESLLEVCRAGVLGYLKTMKANRLLGEWTKAELPLLGWINKWHPIGGRPDVVFRRSDTGITILDGKNSGHKGKYTDPDQLRFYAMVFYLAYREMVDRLGFVYYRFPHGSPVLDKKGNPVLAEDGTPELEEGVDWIPFTKDDLKGLARRAVAARTAMDKRYFDPTPVPSVCRWCDYESECSERQDQIAKNRRRKPKSIEALQGSGKFTDLEL